MAAPLKVGGQPVCGLHATRPIRIGPPGLLAVRARQPAEEVLERAILHHHPDNVLDARSSWLREAVRRGGTVRTRPHWLSVSSPAVAVTPWSHRRLLSPGGVAPPRLPPSLVRMLHLLACRGGPWPMASRAGQGRAPVCGPLQARVSGSACAAAAPQTAGPTTRAIPASSLGGRLRACTL